MQDGVKRAQQNHQTHIQRNLCMQNVPLLQYASETRQAICPCVDAHAALGGAHCAAMQHGTAASETAATCHADGADPVGDLLLCGAGRRCKSSCLGAGCYGTPPYHRQGSSLTPAAALTAERLQVTKLHRTSAFPNRLQRHVVYLHLLRPPELIPVRVSDP